ncbi:LexA family transcriptional regulator [Francisella tularensis]|uniref:LexA family transcriptional regulator n=1 Tax=Francisella tularensis TaxID=263 RepID=UPI0008F53627|nr:S24 family peptidase [Francisella tularensis]APA83259.1 SOS-response repressor and protease LexA [Francisella tularensis subsp. novicida PA10-7858]
MNYISNKELIEELKRTNISKVKLAKECGVSRQSIYQWIDGNAFPKGNTRDKLVNALGLNESTSTTTISTVIEKVHYVPVLSYVQAGEFTEADEPKEVIEYIPLPANEAPKNSFLMAVRGDSMTYDYSPSQRLKIDYARFSISEGEKVLVDTSKTNIDCLVGKVVVAHNGQGTTVKLVYLEEKGICLMPLNSRFQNNDEIKRPDEARIIGQVIDVINKRNFR